MPSHELLRNRFSQIIRERQLKRVKTFGKRKYTLKIRQGRLAQATVRYQFPTRYLTPRLIRQEMLCENIIQFMQGKTRLIRPALEVPLVKVLRVVVYLNPGQADPFFSSHYKPLLRAVIHVIANSLMYPYVYYVVPPAVNPFDGTDREIDSALRPRQLLHIKSQLAVHPDIQNLCDAYLVALTKKTQVKN